MFLNSFRKCTPLMANCYVKSFKLLQQQQQQHWQRPLSHFCGLQSTQRISTSHATSGPHHMRLCALLLPLPLLTGVNCSAAAASTLAKSHDKNPPSSSSARQHIDDIDNMSGSTDYKNAKSIYEFSVKDTHGNDVSLEKYKGNVVLIVNIASKCGLTKNNYAKLTELLEKYEDKGLRILNFPCNQFGSQMPESDGEPMVCHLRDAKANIGDVFQKVDVNGGETAPIYQYLKAKQTGTLGSAIKWNFTKFLVNKEGVPINRYAPTTDPMDIAKDIEKLL